MKKSRKEKVQDKANRLKKLRERGLSVREVQANEINYLGEVEYIVQRAVERDGRVVSLGVLVFFSTQTGDAWMLDIEDEFALCLARDGEPQPVRIMETESQAGIEWDRNYTIDGDRFITMEKSTGRITTILGYPTQAILATIELVREAKG